MENQRFNRSSLGKALNVTHSTVARWLAGSVPGGESLQSLAQLLCVDAQWLLYGTGAAKPYEIAKSDGKAKQSQGSMSEKGLSPEYLERRSKFLAEHYPPEYLLDTVVAMLKDGEARQVAAEETLHKIEAALRLSGYW